MVLHIKFAATMQVHIYHWQIPVYSQSQLAHHFGGMNDAPDKFF